MNFLPAAVLKAVGGMAELSLMGYRAVFRAPEALVGLGKEALVGVRPEFLPIREDGAIEGRIYSTLPAGMETTVKAQCGDTMLTSVVFGSVDYPVDAAVRMAVTGENIVLFDKESGKSVGVGKLEIG